MKHKDKTMSSTVQKQGVMGARLTSGGVYKREKKSPRALIVLLLCLAGCSVAGCVLYRFLLAKRGGDTFHNLREQWSSYDYMAVYDTSNRIMDRLPLNNTALTYHGYASFYLGVSMTEAAVSQSYLDEAINCLRLALMDARKNTKGQIEYMLGKAYFYKNSNTSYYYADSSIKYLNAAVEDGYSADDISEYLGLNYAALGMTMQSIASLTEALLSRESDSLLLSIAEQYGKAGQTSAAEQYLFRVINGSSDDALVNKAQVALASLYVDNGRYEDASKMYNELLEANSNNADAYYGLGLIAEKQGDMVKARAWWRKALRIEVNHQGALEKLRGE